MTLRALCASVTITGIGGARQFFFCKLLTDTGTKHSQGLGKTGVKIDKNEGFEVELKN